MTTPTDTTDDFPTVAPAEPAWSTGTYVALGSLVASGLVAVGIPVTADQKVWIIGAIALLGPLIAALLIRAKVFSPATVEKMMDKLVAQLEDAKDAADAARADSRAQEMAHSAALQAVKITVQDAIPQALAMAPVPTTTGPQPVYAAQVPAPAQAGYQTDYEPYDAPRQPQGADWASPRASYDREATRGYERPAERGYDRQPERRARRNDRPDLTREPQAPAAAAAERRSRHGYGDRP